ncbi:B-cell linker protein [Stigmatopora nigra]
MEIISKITASATAKIRQLQKITQDIQKNDNSFLIKLKRLKTKPVPEVPVRDYKEQVWSAEPEYDNDIYDNPLQGHDINYEPPPSHSVIARTSSSSFPIEAYVDSCSNWPNKGYRKAVKRCKEPQRFPPQPSHMDNSDEDYINPDDSNEDNNYVEPAGNPPSEQTESQSGENGTINKIKDADIYGESWFAGECDRNTAYQLLFHAKEDGAFIVRKSSGQNTNQPYTLVVYCKGKVYNIPIRFIHTRQQFALGSEKKTEVYFHSISHIIEKHQKKPLVLIDSKSNSKDAVMLRPLKETTTAGHHQSPDAFLPIL